MYIDETNGDLKYANCNISYAHLTLSCHDTVIDNIGIGAYGVFPEINIYSDFQTEPILSYFNTTNDTSGSMKFLECETKLLDCLFCNLSCQTSYRYNLTRNHLFIIDFNNYHTHCHCL